MSSGLRNPLIIGVIVIILIIAFFLYKQSGSAGSEGFETLQDKLQDRTNPLAAQQNPLTNPAAAIGISETLGANLRKVAQAALNIPTTSGSESVNPLSPRIDNENSFLGLVKFCKENGVGKTPFNDPAFAANCGMCLTSGKLITGESFTTPTGVVIYAKDKEAAVKDQVTEGALFPRVLPSLDSATCIGASTSPESTPVLAINQKDYDAFTKRIECRNKHTLGGECSQCVSNKEYSWVGKSAGLQTSSLILWGEGVTTVRIGGQVVGAPGPLSMSQASVFPLGAIQESTSIQVQILRKPRVNNVASEDPYVYGILQSTRPNNKPYRLGIERFMERDSIANSYPRRNPPKYFSDASMYLPKLMTLPGKDGMMLEGIMPLTFVASDELAAYDCPTSPFVSTNDNAFVFISDPCLNPRGQSVGNYTDACVKSKILEAGCSTDGDWYKSVTGTNLGISIEELMSFISGIMPQVNTDPQLSMLCKGINISTPCDSYIGSPAVPDTQCLKYLYTNTSEKNSRIGRSYRESTQHFNSLNDRTLQFCQPTGTLNPDKPGGEAELIKAAGGYKGLLGMEAVKKYLSDVFTKATGNLDVNLTDEEGGRKTSWMKCFGRDIADPLLVGGVKKNSRNDVVNLPEPTQCEPTFPDTYDTLMRNNYLGTYNSTGNYVISFKIMPKGNVQEWSNIFHFSKNACNYGAECRTPALWFWPGSTTFHVRIGDSTDWNWGLDTSNIPIGQWSSFRLECNGKQVNLTVNSQVYTATQPTTRSSGVMHAWMPAFWYAAANVAIKDFCYKTL